MQSRKHVCGWLVLGLALVILGCRDEAIPPDEPESSSQSESAESDSSDLASQLAEADRGENRSPMEDMASEESAEAAPAQPATPPPPRTIPKVVLTKSLDATCLVKVGDSFPDGDLVDLEGQAQTLQVLWGSKLTVVVFWAGDNPYAQQELQDLQRSVAEPYESKGVQAVGINVKDSPETVRAKLDQAKATFPNLRDADGVFFAKVATAKLPRTYLLDAEGKILWFDLEYSTATRRNLLQAIQVALGEG